MRVCKRELIRRMADGAGISVKSAGLAYESLTKTILEEVGEGNRVCLNGIGTFGLKVHKSSPMGFKPGFVQDEYLVFKFSPSEVATARFRDQCQVHTTNLQVEDSLAERGGVGV